MKKILLLTIVALWSATAFAAPEKELKTDNLTIVKKGQSINIGFTVNIGDRAKSRDYKLVLTPVLYNGTTEEKLKQIVVETRRTRIVDERNGVAPLKGAYMAEFGNKIDYTITIPYEGWMEGSSLRLDQLVCGCCTEDFSTMALGSGFKFVIPVYNITPHYSYVKPDAEIPKYRHESGAAYVEFQQGRSVLLADFRSNAAELSKIRNSINLVKEQEGTTITDIDLMGSCSPEGSWLLNSKLAAERVSVVRAYIIAKYGVSGDIIKANSIPEDWATFKTLIERSDIAEKEAVLAIINSDKDPDVKDKELSKLPIYNSYLMNTIYPQLRKVDYRVNYIVKGFDLEESKRVLETMPKNLNLIEMYVIANSYPKGSAEFNRAFEIAAREFPTDAVAATNAAITAYNNGDIAKAESYLSNIKSSEVAEYNNMVGVLAMVKGDYTKAETYLKKAADKGLADAKANLEELNKKLENIKAIKEN